jgi:hypothetical protein
VYEYWVTVKMPRALRAKISLGERPPSRLRSSFSVAAARHRLRN